MTHLTMTQEIVQRSEWIIPVLLLFVVAWTRFNSPPTNRSGTTFVLFFFGVIFYYALIVALWLLVIIGVQAVQQFFIRLDEPRLLLWIELARHRLWFAMFHAKAVQQRDQARPALGTRCRIPSRSRRRPRVSFEAASR